VRRTLDGHRSSAVRQQVFAEIALRKRRVGPTECLTIDSVVAHRSTGGSDGRSTLDMEIYPMGAKKKKAAKKGGKAKKKK